MKRIKEIQKKIVDVNKFVAEGIWLTPLSNLSKKKALFYKIGRIAIITYREFTSNKIASRASALTYFSLLSIVPVLAMGFGIAKGFGLEDGLINFLIQNFSEQKEVLDWMLEFTHKLLDNVKGNMIAGFGLIILVFTVMKLLNNIEIVFNDIWKIKKARPFARKFTDYTTIILLAPLLVIVSSSLTVFISTKIRHMAQVSVVVDMMTPLLVILLKLLSYTLIWLLLLLIYLIMPNTRVNFLSGIISGILAGTIYQLTQWFYITFQIGVSHYNTIYGSFAAVPLFLIWMQLSWLIVLAGAQLSYTIQNIHKYEFNHGNMRMGLAFKRLASLLIVRIIVKNFAECKPPVSSIEISKIMETPLHIIERIIKDLIESKIIVEIRNEENKSIGFQPAMDIQKISVYKVTDSLEQHGFNDIPLVNSEETIDMKNRMDFFRETLQKCEANALLKDI